jgi:uncharacterized protein (TIGR02001 family)
LLASNTLLLEQKAAAETLGGEIAVSSDAIYRGVSENAGQPAVAFDVHIATLDGTYAGAFTTTRDHALAPGAAADMDVYFGRRLTLSDAWSARLTAYSHQYMGGAQRISDDYQELTAQVAYLDLWSFSVAAIPNSVRYMQPVASTGTGYLAPARVGRYAAWIAATQLQWLITSRLLLTGAAGYYFVQGDDDAFQVWPGGPVLRISSTGYAYGNAGLAYQWQRWRLDVGYFLADSRATAQIYPYPAVHQHVAATLSWRF